MVNTHVKEPDFNDKEDLRINYFDQPVINMASSCMQLCLHCRRFLLSKPVASAWHYYPTASGSPTKVANASLVVRWSHKTTWTQQRWMQQILFSNNFAVKHLSTDTKEKKGVEELSITDVVSYKSPLLPVKDAVPMSFNQMPLDLDAPTYSALEIIDDDEAVGIVVPPALPPSSTSLRDYVDHSETLKKLVELGVNLWKIEQRPNVGSMLMRLNFDTDVAPKLLFLKDIGVDGSRFGYIITRNPFLLTENLENLQARVNYLKSKNFSGDTVASMVSRAPYLLNFSVKRLDNRLCFFQNQLSLSASNTRNVVARLPRLLCGSLEPIKENLKVCEIEFGFKKNEIQHIVTAVPKVLTANKKKLTQIFDYLHNTMKVPHHLIAKFPQVLNSKYLRIRERHLFLEYLGKAQYDPALPTYISLDRLVSLPDESFCTDVASATVKDFYLFQKTL